MMVELEEQSRKGGLGMNIYKTKIINKQEDKNEVKMKTFKMETCNKATYLDQKISLKDKMEHEINIRISKAWAKFWSLKDIFKSNFNNQQKSQVFNMCVLPCMTYGCQTWMLTNRLINKIRTILKTRWSGPC